MATSARVHGDAAGGRAAGGVPMRELLDVPALAGHRVLAGHAGLGRVVQGANVMEVPDILDWVRPHEFLITTAYSLREDPLQIVGLVEQLADRGLAGLGIKLGRYVERLPDDAVAVADAAAFPVIGLPTESAHSDLLHQVLTRILDRQATAKSGADLLYALIGRRLDDEDEILRRASTLGWRLDRPLRVVVAEPVDGGGEPLAATTGPRTDGPVRPADGDAPDGPRRARAVVPPTSGVDGLAAHLSRLVRERDEHGAAVPLGDEVVVVCAEPADGGDAFDRSPTFAATACTAGISRTCHRPIGMAEAYVQARRAATVGRQMHGPGTTTRFDDLGSLRLLSHVPDDELHDFVEDVLGPVLGDDEASAVLRHTLSTLLEANANLAETARRLHFHYNTVRARVARLEELLGPVTTDHRRRVDVTLALQVLQLDGAAD